MYSNPKLGSTTLTLESKEYRKIKKVKKTLKQRFRYWLTHDDDHGEQPQAIGAISAEPRYIDQPERALQFTVYNANGGRVVETRRYDRQKDRHNQNLYIITAEQDFGREIDKIITMEALR